VFQHILYNSKPDNKSQLLNVINNCPVDTARDAPPFDKTTDAVAEFIEPYSQQLVIPADVVRLALCQIKTFRAVEPDGIFVEY
jgi:hypothetical protein